MVRTKFIIVSDEQDVVQRAKAFAASSGVSCEVYTTSEWENKTMALPTTQEKQTSEKGAKILPFPGNNLFVAKKVQTINELESVAIEKAISEYNGNLTEAARALGIGRATLYRKVKQYGLDPSNARKKRAA